MQCKQIFCYDHDITKDDVVFICAVQGEPRLELREGAAIEWMTLDTIKGLKLAFEQENIIP
jgi:hypothetical protein